jgi:hypothetical protein
MKSITVTLPEDKVDFFLNLARELGYSVDALSDEVPQTHVTFLKERMETINEEELVNLSDFERNYRTKE